MTVPLLGQAASPCVTCEALELDPIWHELWTNAIPRDDPAHTIEAAGRRLDPASRGCLSPVCVVCPTYPCLDCVP